MSQSRVIVATAALMAALTGARNALAVDCPTAQTLTGSNGFGRAVAMYDDGITGEYVVVSDSSNTWYYQKSPGSTATFGSPTLLTNRAGALAVGHGTVLIGHSGGPGGVGVVDVFQQATDSSGTPLGPPFTYTGTIDLRNSTNLVDPAFGQSVSYDWANNIVTACGSTGCYFFSNMGGGNNWTRLTVALPGASVAMWSQGLEQYGYAMMAGVPCGGAPCFNVYEYQEQFGGLFSYSQFSTLNPSGTGGTFQGYAPWIDRAFVGVTGAQHGSILTYSNNYLGGGGSFTAPWSTVPNLHLTSGTAGPNFGAQVASDGDFVLATDPMGPGSTVHVFQIFTNNTATITDDSYVEQSPQSTFGSAVDIDGACAAIGDPSQNTVELFPIDQPLPTLTASSSGVNVSVPAIGTTGNVTLTVDPTCMQDFVNVVLDSSNRTCAKVTANVEVLGLATMCFPSFGQNLIYRCDPRVAQCASPSFVHPAPDGSLECCVPINNGTPSGSQYCVQTPTFSKFASATGYADTDGDGLYDLGDNCPKVSNIFQTDQDNDLIGDACDNCPAVPNQDQRSTHGVSVGDACNCAIPGVKTGPTGTACPPPPPVPAVPRPMGGILWCLLLSVGAFAAGGGRRFFRHFGT